MKILGNQPNRKPHRKGGSKTRLEGHTAADGYGKGKVKCPSCRGKGRTKVYASHFDSQGHYVECSRCGGRGWV